MSEEVSEAASLCPFRLFFISDLNPLVKFCGGVRTYVLQSPAIVGCDEEREGSGGRTRVAQVRAEGDPELQAPKVRFHPSRANHCSSIEIDRSTIHHSRTEYAQPEVLISVDDARRRRRAYFRCTHKHDQQCAAQRQVQRRDDDPDAYTVTYIGAHTCRDPATAADDELHAGSRLISFAAANATTASTTTTTGNASNRQAGHKGAVLPAEPPRQLEGGGGGGEREQELELEEVLSSLTPAGSSAATAEAVRTATPGPDQGDVTSGLQLQQQQQHWFGGGGLSGVAHLGYDDTFDLEDIVFGSITGGMYAAEY